METHRCTGPAEVAGTVVFLVCWCCRRWCHATATWHHRRMKHAILTCQHS